MQQLTVSPDRRYLQYADGTPFFLLGDTAWMLFHKLNREDASLYLADRAAKRFNAVFVMGIAQFGGLTTPNAYGEMILHDMDPTRPNEAYFQHIDYIVDTAASHGIYTGYLPTWGNNVLDWWWSGGHSIFTPENAYVYGEFLGKRYRDKPVIWVLGGDRPAETEAKKAIWRAMAAGLKAGDGGSHLITYHSWMENSSSDFFHGDEWLDFNTIQTSHVRRDNSAAHWQITANYNLYPPKPVMNIEPCYEDHAIDGKPENGYFDDYDVRQACYWSVFAGGCGITYGCMNIWQFRDGESKPLMVARLPWKPSLDLPGAQQMTYLRNLYESRPFHLLVPDQSMVCLHLGEGPSYSTTVRATDDSFSFTYLPQGGDIWLTLERFPGVVVAHWFNPRTGEWTYHGEFANTGIPHPDKYPNQAAYEFIAPSKGRGEDWVLVLDAK